MLRKAYGYGSGHKISSLFIHNRFHIPKNTLLKNLQGRYKIINLSLIKLRFWCKLANIPCLGSAFHTYEKAKITNHTPLRCPRRRLRTNIGSFTGQSSNFQEVFRISQIFFTLISKIHPTPGGLFGRLHIATEQIIPKKLFLHSSYIKLKRTRTMQQWILMIITVILIVINLIVSIIFRNI